jgi:hypothetical protein
MIADPCYLDKWKGGNFYPTDLIDVEKLEAGKRAELEERNNNDYADICNLTLEEGAGEIRIRGGGFVVASRTLYGDGFYPVYGLTNEYGQVTKLVIGFEPDFEDVD